MTAKEAERLGYVVVAASAAEVGLIKGDKGVMTWWCLDFDRILPPLDHPKILEAIERHEKYERDMQTESTERGRNTPRSRFLPAPPSSCQRGQEGIAMVVLLWIAKMPAGWVLWFVGEGR